MLQIGLVLLHLKGYSAVSPLIHLPTNLQCVSSYRIPLSQSCVHIR